MVGSKMLGQMANFGYKPSAGYAAKGNTTDRDTDKSFVSNTGGAVGALNAQALDKSLMHNILSTPSSKSEFEES